MKWWTKLVDKVTGTEKVQVRARNDKGRYVADDKSTPDVNEAYTTKRVKKSNTMIQATCDKCGESVLLQNILNHKCKPKNV